MASWREEPYEYSALPTPTSTRVLTVLRGDDKDVIFCKVKIINLSDKPVYNCLSYTWADPDSASSQRLAINCDGKAMLVTSNLYNALHTLQNDIMDCIWIDSVSINQVDLAERAAQVQLMGAIYHGAATVVVWLGAADSETEGAFNVLRILSSVRPVTNTAYNITKAESYEQLGIPFIVPENWSAYRKLLERSWFRRTWTLQESFLAQRIILACGNFSISWNDLDAHYHFLRGTSWFSAESVFILKRKIVRATFVPKENDRFRFVGEAYVHGIMNGEAAGGVLRRLEIE